MYMYQLMLDETCVRHSRSVTPLAERLYPRRHTAPPQAEQPPENLGTHPGTLAGWFQRGLRRSARSEALRIGRQSYTFEELHNRALALAGDVVALAGPHPRRVGLLASRTFQAYAGVLAAQYAGAAVVPLNPDFPAERTMAMMRAAGLDALIADERGAGLLPQLADALDGVAVVAEPNGVPLSAPIATAPDDVAYILFTSGSTGRPKGVPVLHRNVDAYLRFVHARYGFGPDDVFSQTFELTFDLAMFDLFAGWGAGAAVVCVPPRALGSLDRFLTEQGVTVWFSAPSAIGFVRGMGALNPGTMPKLRWSLFCGEPLLARDAAVWQEAAPGSRVENLYGPTELTISCSVYRWDPHTTLELCVNGIVPIGTVHTGTRYLIHDPELGVGAETGELCVTGEQMFPGYLDPQDNEGRFLEHEGERWYRTGDLVRELEGGDLVYLGRRDHQVKISGVRVELAEVEWALRRVSGISDAVAAVHEGALVAFCVGDRRPLAQIAEELGAFLPRVLVPRKFIFVDEFPLNSNRKVDRKALAARIEEPVLAGAGAGRG
jgi:amino acid adenylation domain-containing protein